MKKRVVFGVVGLALLVVSMVWAGIQETVLFLPFIQTERGFQVRESAETFNFVTDVTAVDGDDRIFVLEQAGVVRVLLPDGSAETFLDIQERICDIGVEQGALGLAFSPDYGTSGQFYLVYITSTSNDCGENEVLRVARFNVTADPNRADPNSETEIYTIGMRNRIHNGGGLMFHPLDGMLYLSVGDDANSGLAQSDEERHGRLLRLDLSGGEADEVAKGLRNPWRFGIDPVTGDFYIGDVGLDIAEEVNHLSYGETSRLGRNFGWHCVEGVTIRFDTGVCDDPESYAQPIFAYGHGNGAYQAGCSVTAGHVIHGSPLADGHFVFSDFCHDILYGLQRVNNVWEVHELGALSGNGAYNVSDMHLLPNDELLVASYAPDAPILFVHIPNN